MTQDPAGSLLSFPPPQVPPQALAALVATHWGLTGTLHPLTSERDQNHRLDTGTASYTLKLANPAEPSALTDFQTQALLHTAREAPNLPTPRVIPTRDGHSILPTPDGALRLLTWLPGTPSRISPAPRPSPPPSAPPSENSTPPSPTSTTRPPTTTSSGTSETPPTSPPSPTPSRRT